MKSLLTFTLLGVLASALPSTAATIQATYTGYYGGTVDMTLGGVNKGSVGGGIFTFDRTGGTYLDGPELSLDGNFLAMCIEPTERISSSSTVHLDRA